VIATGKEKPMARRVRGPALAGLVLLAACASSPEIPETFGLEATAAEESTPLGGEALTLRKNELQRAQRDMGHFAATIETLRQRRDRSGMVLMAQFVDSYMGKHLDPLLNNEWQSNHPELMALDASLRLAKAELMIEMRSPRRVQQVLDDIEQRFSGRKAMLVEYPIGGQTTLEQALALLRQRKWRG
jgi:hypothetical protein